MEDVSAEGPMEAAAGVGGGGGGAAAAALHFGWLDYSSFVAVMLVSALVGVYYGFFKKQNSVDEYFLGGRSMGVLPIAMSLISGNISGVTMLAVPADIYAYGSTLALVAVVGIPVVVLTVYLFLPTFYKLQYESSYEYLEHRFSPKIRTLTSVFFTIQSYLYMPIVMYVPCLAFYQVSGVNVHVVNALTCLTVIFYTCMGGLRAVVWTDALQLISLILASVVVVIVGILKVGGLSEVWERADQGGRLEIFNMNPSLTERTTFWNVMLGEGVYFLNNLSTSAGSVQRYLSLPTLSAAKNAAWVLAIGFVVTRGLSCVVGVVMYAYYHDCDPVVQKVVPNRDHLVPHFVVAVAQGWPGLSGVFIAGVFSAALSTVSSLLNTLAGTLYKDFIEKRLRTKPDDKRASHILKLITLVLGLGIFVCVFVVEKLGSILETGMTLTGVASGASFGIFLLGLFVPWAEEVGAWAGALSSLVIMSTICMGSLVARNKGAIKYIPLPKRTDGCNSTLPLLPGTTTTAAPVAAAGMPTVVFDDDLFPLFRISPFYLIVLGVVLTVAVGAAVSAVVRAVRSRRGDPGGWDDLPHPDLFSPPVGSWVRRRMAATAGVAMGVAMSAPRITRDADVGKEAYQAVATSDMTPAS